MTVPSELTAYDQWMIWKFGKTRSDGGREKPPRRAADGVVSSKTEPSNWASFEDARAACKRRSYDGVGFCLTKEDPFVGIDFDRCIVNGQIVPEVQKYVDLLDSYTERSPSGTGLRVFVRGRLEKGGFHPKEPGPWGGGFEVYDRDSFLTVTGESTKDESIKERQEQLEILISELVSEASLNGSPGDWLTEARQDPEFVALYDEGDISGHESPSQADIALMNKLVRLIGLSPRSIFYAFQTSKLYRGDGKSGGDDYVLRTMDKAFDRFREEVEQPSEKRLEREVTKQVFMLEAREEARRRHAAKGVPPGLGLPSTKWSLVSELELPDLEPTFRVEELHPWGGNVLLIAAYKSGKTAITLNLLRALADGTPFLNRFPVAEFDGNICIVNYEETPAQWRRHVRKLGIKNPDRIFPIHRRGEPILPIWEENAQEVLAEWMLNRNIKYWIMDPTVVAWQGLVDNENDNALVAAFTTALDQVKLKAHVSELLLTHHEGRLTEGRGRGATRLEDWMDAGWYLSRDPETNQRSLSAKGRDVELERFDLEWTEDKWQLSAGESVVDHRKQAKVEKEKLLKQIVYEILQDLDGDEIIQSELLVKVKDAGIKGDTQWLTGKFKGYCDTPTTPGPGYKREGSKVLYYWRKKEAE